MFNISSDGSITITQGDSGDFTVKLWDDKDKTQPFDLTGLNVLFGAARSQNGKVSPAIITLSTGQGIEVTLPNIINISFLPEHTRNMQPGEYVYDIEINDGNDFVKTLSNEPLAFFVTPQVAK